MKIMKGSRRHVGRSRPASNKIRLSMRAATLLFVCALGSYFVTAYAGEPLPVRALQRPVNKQRSDRSALRLVLETPKAKYRVGEPLVITFYLENVSQDDHYYIGTDISDLTTGSPFHYIDLSIIDEKGIKLLLPRSASDSAGEPSRPTAAEKLAREYVQLRPGAIYGFRTEVLEPHLKAGRYRLNATYYETEALSWTEAERKSLSIPVWMQPLISNTVTITVVP